MRDVSRLLFVLIPLIAGCCDKAAVPKEISKLYSEKAQDRNAAALALAGCGSLAESAVPRLAQLLYDNNVGVQSSAAYALRKINSPAAARAIESAEAARAARRAR